MKKFWIMFIGDLVALVAIAWTNNAVLLHLHPLEYYYTSSGLLLAFCVNAVEISIVWPLSAWYIKKLGSVLKEANAKESLES